MNRNTAARIQSFAMVTTGKKKTCALNNPCGGEAGRPRAGFYPANNNQQRGGSMTDVMLTDGTVGKMDHTPTVGDDVTVHLHDENGNEIEKTGTVSDIL